MGSVGASKGHALRHRVAGALMRSGYVARHAWSRQEGKLGRWLEGPAAGLRVVDPWAEARKLQGCEAGWAVLLRLGSGGLVPSAMPLPCGRVHTCPVCASRSSRANASAVRAVIGAAVQAGEVGSVVLMTLTQRAQNLETMTGAVERVRAGFRRLRSAEVWKHSVAGAYWGFEVTYRAGRGWHAHIHVVVVLGRGVNERDARAGLGRAWRMASGEAATAAGLDGYGWNPAAGGCRLARRAPEPRPCPLDVSSLDARALRAAARLPWARGLRLSRLRAAEARAALVEAWASHEAARPRRVIDWSGGWWRPMGLDLDQVEQAAKYPSPVASLSGLALVEFLAVARGRRWHDGSGMLRGVHRQAEAMSSAELEQADEAEGVIVCAVAPGACPNLDEVAPGLGWADPSTARLVEAVDPSALVAWRIGPRWAWAPELVEAAAEAGLRWFVGPAGRWVTEEGRPVELGEAPLEAEALWLVGTAEGTARALSARSPPSHGRGRRGGQG